MRIIGGLYKGRILKAPKGDMTRPTSSQLREALFNICQGEFEGIAVLDICSGSGAIGIEALSRGAKSSCFIDSHSLAISALKENLKLLKLEGRILPLDAYKAAQKLIAEGASFEFIYLDPPYEASSKKSAPKTCLAARLLELIDKSTLLKPGGYLFIEEGGLFEKVSALETLEEGKMRLFGKSTLTHYIKR